MRTGIGIFLAAGAAFAFSFAIDLLLGALMGVYPSTAFLPVVTWSVIATVALAVAYKVAAGSRWLAVPFAAFGALALFGALVGPHPHSYGVAALLLAQAFIIWRLGTRPASANGRIVK
jgi:hypothetical protein